MRNSHKDHARVGSKCGETKFPGFAAGLFEGIERYFVPIKLRRVLPVRLTQAAAPAYHIGHHILVTFGPNRDQHSASARRAAAKALDVIAPPNMLALANQVVE
jgi:hypothetical protein